MELARVLAEAGELELLVDWMEGEARMLLAEAAAVLSDLGADPGDRARARVLYDGLQAMFAELRELADQEEEQ
jgi:hypothetical protein